MEKFHANFFCTLKSREILLQNIFYKICHLKQPFKKYSCLYVRPPWQYGYIFTFLIKKEEEEEEEEEEEAALLLYGNHHRNQNH